MSKEVFMANEVDLTAQRYLIPDNVDIYNCQNKSEQEAASYTHITSSNVNWILPIPTTLDYNSDYNWSEEDTSWTASTLSNLKNWITNDGSFNDVEDSAKNQFKSLVRGVIQKGFAPSDSTSKNILKNIGTGLAYNPNKQLYFNEVTMREFSLIFSLAPLSRAEAETIKTGFTAMAKSAAPDVDSTQFFFTYPDYFNVLIQVNGVTLLNRSNLAITSLNLDLSSDGPLTWHNDGFPTALQLSIGFKESEIPTKGNLKNITLFGKSIG